MKKYDFRLVSSMQKVFADTEPVELRDKKLRLFYDDKVSFQLAYYGCDHQSIDLNGLTVEVSWPNHRIRKVQLVPAEFPTNGNDDEYYLRKTAGLYPDLLSDCDGAFMPVAKQWRALWIDLFSDKSLPMEDVDVKVEVFENGESVFSDKVTVKTVCINLDKQDVHHTEWLHVDCLADYYNIEPYSEEHWMAIRNNLAYLHDELSSTMVLTPIFTPALDTAVGGERTTVQLLDVYLDNGVWSFGFDKVRRWCAYAKEIGFEYLEICHLFSQWGAYATPKVMGYVDGEYTRIFGWETNSLDEKYIGFLNRLIPELFDVLDECGYDRSHLFTHISDEPKLPHLENYAKARKSVEHVLEGTCVFDALSDYDIYEQKAVVYPVVSDNHIQTFLDNGVKDLWVYYCVSQSVLVPNRFMAMPPYRARIIGLFIWYYKIQGFLHWGYNFYNTQFSKKHINPFLVTDAGCRFPSGDSFLVYPGDGFSPLGSLRAEYVSQSFRDVRILKTAERYLGRDYIENVIGIKPLFDDYPQNADFIENVISDISEELAKRI